MRPTRPGFYAVLICFLTLSNPLLAQSFLPTGPHVFNYNYAEVKYLDVGSADGFAVAGSADIRSNIAINAEFASLSAGSADLDLLSIGAVSYIGSKAYSQADWVFGVGLDFADANGNSDAGVSVRGGVRYALTDALELNGAIELSTIDDADLSLELAALYEIATGFAALVEADIGEDTAIGVGLRFYWR